MPAELRQIIEGVLLVVAALFPIVNPFGGAPVFPAMTADLSPEMRRALARRVARTAFVLLLGRALEGLLFGVAPALASLKTVTDMLKANQSSLDLGLQRLAPFVRLFANNLGNGRWFDTYVYNLTQPTGFVPGTFGDGS